MPFQSEKQRRYLWANEPEIAREWTDRYGANEGGITRLPFWTGSIPSSRGAVDWSNVFADSSYLPKNFLEEEVVDETLPENLGNGIVGVDQVAEMTGANSDNNYGLNFNNMGSNFFNNFKETLPGRGIRTALNFVTDNPLMAAITGGIGSMVNRYNPLKEGSQNYNPYLEEQIDILRSPGEFQYLSGDDPSGPYRITGGPLAGKNLVSGFGTNDYGRMLDKRIEYFKARKNRTDEQTRKMHETIAERKRIEEEKLRNELKKEQAARPYAPDVGSGGGQSGITSTTTASQASRMGGGSRQAKSGSQKSGGSGRTDSGWGW